jgi:hypothetical protein
MLISFHLCRNEVLLKYFIPFCGLITCILLIVLWISSAMSVVVLYPLISMLRIQSHIKVMGKLKYCIFSVYIVFGLNLISKHCSEFPEFIKTYLFPKFFSCSNEIFYPYHVNIFTCPSVVLTVRVTQFVLMVETCRLSTITVPYTGDIPIPKCFEILCKVHYALCKSSCECDLKIEMYKLKSHSAG